MYLQIAIAIVAFFGIIVNYCIRSEGSERVMKNYFTISSIFSFILSLYIFAFQKNGIAFKVDLSHNLILYFGSTNISSLFAILTAFVMLLVSLEVFSGVKKEDLSKFINLVLLTNIALMGCFFSLDLVSFFAFFEISIVPIFFIILLFGGSKKVLAAKQFLTYTIAGSSLILVSIIYLFAKTQSVLPTEIVHLSSFALISNEVKTMLAVMMVIGFFVKIPTFPFHTWLPLAHVQAPTGGSMILAGILIKLGGFGILQFVFPIFFEQITNIKGYAIAIGLISLIYGSFISFAQTDIKKMIAYSSIAHMSYVVLGLFTMTKNGENGAVFQMISHGVVSSGLFFMIGIIYRRFHTRNIDDYGRLYGLMPIFAKSLLLFSLAACALPGTIGFIGEFMTVTSLASYSITSTLIAASATLFGATYMLNLCYKLLYSNPEYKVEDKSLFSLTLREKASLGLISFVIILFGVFPNLILSHL